MGDLKKYDSISAAKYLLAVANNEGYALNVTQVQKMLYILYGYFLGKFNHIVLDEAPKAWPYGPVFPKTRKKVDFSIVYKVDSVEFSDMEEDENFRNAIRDIAKKYSRFSAGKLSKWSHTENSPWTKTTNTVDFKWGDTIPDDLIKEYFAQLDV